MKNSFYFLVVLMGLTTLAGCSSSGEKDTDTKDTPQVEEQATKEGDEDKTEATSEASGSSDSLAQSDEKLLAYVDCINGHSNRALSSYDRYLSWANEATGPTGAEKNIYGLYTLTGATTKCVAGIKASNALKPSYPALEQAAGSYSTALTKLEPLLEEANEYYTEQNYKDDAMAKGKELHPKLMEAFKAFEAADGTLRTELEKIQDELDVKRLTELEKTEGKKYAYLSTNSMIMAKKVINLGNVADLKEIKVDELQKATEAFEKAVDELKAYDKAHKSELGVGVSIDSFIRGAGDLVTAAKELTRRVRDNTPYDTGELMTLGGPGGWMVNGSPDKLLNVYNSLVQTSNGLRF